MLSRKVWLDQMMILESIYKISVVTLPDNEPRETALKKSMIKLWYDSVENIPDEVFIAAVANLIRSHQYETLKPANIVEQCKLILMQLAGDESQAWKEVNKSLVYCHRSSTTEQLKHYCSETTIQLIDELGGFEIVSNMNQTEFSIAQNRFRKRHKEVVEYAVQVKINTGNDLLEFNEQKLLEVK